MCLRINTKSNKFEANRVLIIFALDKHHASKNGYNINISHSQNGRNWNQGRSTTLRLLSRLKPEKSLRQLPRYCTLVFLGFLWHLTYFKEKMCNLIVVYQSQISVAVCLHETFRKGKKQYKRNKKHIYGYLSGPYIKIKALNHTGYFVMF